MKYLSFFFAVFISYSAFAEDVSWNFIWVSAGSDGWKAQKGIAQVIRNGKKFEAKIQREDSVDLILKGTITKDRVSATYTVLESDFFVDAPFSGTYHLNRYKDVEPCGSEVISLSDGYNFIGLRRSFHDEKCKL
jgi:hypothetical protein